MQSAGRYPTRDDLWDGLVAAGCLALALGVHVTGSDAVPANRDADVLTVALTVLAVAPVALRRRYPLAVLATAIGGLLGLVVVRGSVGVTTLGLLVAFCTAVAVGSPRQSRAAVGLLLGSLALTALLRPVDLSGEGAATTGAVLAGGWVLAVSARSRRERAVAEVEAARRGTELERERAVAAEERAAWHATQERLRIVRELHDVVGHALSVMVVQAGVAERLLDTRPDQARRAVEEIGRSGRGSLTEMRHILGALREGDPDEHRLLGGRAPTLDDVDRLADGLREAGLAVTVDVVGRRRDLPAGIDLAGYRIVQEALTNSLRHAGASSVEVTVTYDVDAVAVDVRDDGPAGAAGATAASGGGHGIAGMRERVAIYGGRFSAGPVLGGGFGVHARFPDPALVRGAAT